MRMASIRKSEVVLPKEIFDLVFGVSNGQKWLRTRTKGLINLFDICENSDERQLIFDLLSRFHYLDDDGFNKKIDEIIEYFHALFENDFSQVVFAPLYNDNKDGRSDSSFAALYRLKTRFPTGRMSRYRDSNSAFRAIHLPDVKSVVMVDDFSGTGKQASDVLKSLSSQIKSANLNVHLHVGTIASMAKAMRAIKPHVESHYSCLILNRGISDHYSFLERKKMIELMKNIEGKFQAPARYNSVLRKLYHRGFQESESLFKCENSRTANNVFPALYWRYLKNGEEIDNILEPY